MTSVSDARALVEGRAAPLHEIGAASLAVQLATLDKLTELVDLLRAPREAAEPEPTKNRRK